MQDTQPGSPTANYESQGLPKTNSIWGLTEEDKTYFLDLAFGPTINELDEVDGEIKKFGEWIEGPLDGEEIDPNQRLDWARSILWYAMESQYLEKATKKAESVLNRIDGKKTQDVLLVISRLNDLSSEKAQNGGMIDRLRGQNGFMTFEVELIKRFGIIEKKVSGSMDYSQKKTFVKPRLLNILYLRCFQALNPSLDIGTIKALLAGDKHL